MSTDKSKTIAGQKFHFIGVGGVGMSGLARIMLDNGADISGSDATASAVTDRLIEMGAEIKIGHAAVNLENDVSSVVISAAIKEDNAELELARKRQCKVYKYSQMLGYIMDQFEGIAISGTHGKSTTGGWLSYCMHKAGTGPNFIIGAEISQLNCSSGTGAGEYFIAEACEYDRSFLNLKPKIGCVLNIEQDHLDYYRDEQDIIDAFTDFASNIRDDGVLIANGDDANVMKMLEKVKPGLKTITFESSGNCDFYADNIRDEDGCSSFDVYYKGEFLSGVKIALAGGHNVLNALAVISIAAAEKLDLERIIQHLGEFTGMDRRLMLKDRIEGVTVVDDYAHHPTEIRASLAALRQKYKPQRILCIFQPHQYSRTRFLLDDFAESFKLSDITIVPEIYFVRDTQESRRLVNAGILAQKINSNGNKAIFIDGFNGICEYLKQNVIAGDLVVTMGAGDIWKVADEYIQWLRRDS